ncbi:hypothetical protein ABZV92_18785 [Streptomyces rubiginosohelvolus]|uniref:hypothetical protein n=1 Tax=Streptomyces rubiginosohelvolus TaxID=67362 RepID=UPI0033A42A86
MMLWQRGFLFVVLATGVVGGVIAARSGDGLPAVQFAAVAVIASGGLTWKVIHLAGRGRRR